MSRTTSLIRFVNAARSRAGVFGLSIAVAIRFRIATSRSRVDFAPDTVGAATFFDATGVATVSPVFTDRNGVLRGAIATPVWEKTQREKWRLAGR